MVIEWLVRFGGKIAAGFGVVLAFLYAHQRAKQTAANDAVKTERQRIELETVKQKQKIKKAAHEINEAHRNLPADDLRSRMRDAATDRDNHK